MHPFRSAIEAGDVDGAVALLAEDVVFRSPVVFKPYEGREAVRPLLHAVSQVLEDFRYVRELGGDGDSDHALIFRARVGDKAVEGLDLLHTRGDGMVDELVVMIRPLSGIIAVAEAMGARLAAG